MARINDELLDCVIYLYGSKDEALAGENIGGSGFLVSYPSSKGNAAGGFIYAVTNRHVIRQKCSTVRLNTADGKMDVFEFHPSSWTCSETDDLAVRALPGAISATEYRFKVVPRKMFLTREMASPQVYNIGVGDDVKMIGRFINIEGKQKNTPTARFGCIAQMPLEPIQSEDLGVPYGQESFLADIKSIGGYSGSPVFWEAFPAPDKPRPNNVLPREYLLGVDWAHIMNWSPVCGIDGKPQMAGNQVELNTGIAAIVPAWKLLDLLDDHPMLKSQREKAEEAFFSKKTMVAKTDAVFAPPANDENPTHQEDFTRLVSLAARKPAPKD